MESRPKPPTLKLAQLGFIFLLGLLLRIWGTDFSLPYLHHPDEGAVVMPALRVLATGDCRPFRLDYGSIYIYSITALSVPYYLYGYWLGYFKSTADIPIFTSFNDVCRYPFPKFYLLPRLLTAIIGSLSILVVFLLARRITSEQGALASSLFLALEPLHVRNSHFATTDVPMTFLVLLAINRMLAFQESGKRDDFLWAGFFCGLAASTKFTAGLLCLGLVWAHIFRSRTPKDLIDRRIILGGVATAGAFLLGTPYAMDFSYFLNWLTSNSNYYANGLGKMEEPSSFLYYCKTLWDSNALPILTVAIPGVYSLAAK